MSPAGGWGAASGKKPPVITMRRRPFHGWDMAPWLFWAVCVFVVAARLVAAGAQRVFLIPEGSSLDDMLMVRGAMSLAQGNWLGAYGPIAIAKHMGFSFWVALLHVLGVPYLVGNAALWVAASAFAVWCLKPLFSGRLARCVLFAVFAFFPFSFADYTMRAYRDAVFQALCFAAFAGALGLGLRLRDEEKGKGVAASLKCALGCGVALAAVWLWREDGAVTLVYPICAAVLFLLFAFLLWRRGGLSAKGFGLRAVCAVLPFAVVFAGIFAMSAGNYANYGVFMVSDFSGGTFPGAYGALVGVSEGESGWKRWVPVTQAGLAAAYDEVPALAEIRQELEEPGLLSGFGDRAKTGEYGGSFYYALRLAADAAGKTPDGKTAQAYWARMEREINTAVAEGRLQTAGAASGMVPRWNAELLGPLVQGTGGSMLHALTFAECDLWPGESMGEQEKIAPVAEFLHAKTQYGKTEGTDQNHYSLWRRVMLTGFDGITWVWRVAVWPLLALALWRWGRLLAAGLRGWRQAGRPGFDFFAALLWLGLLLAFVLRCGVAAYMDVASFGLGPGAMYLSGGVPALLLFLALGAAGWPGADAIAPGRPIRNHQTKTGR